MLLKSCPLEYLFLLLSLHRYFYPFLQIPFYFYLYIFRYSWSTLIYPVTNLTFGETTLSTYRFYIYTITSEIPGRLSWPSMVNSLTREGIPWKIQYCYYYFLHRALVLAISFSIPSEVSRVTETHSLSPFYNTLPFCLSRWIPIIRIRIWLIGVQCKYFYLPAYFSKFALPACLGVCYHII